MESSAQQALEIGVNVFVFVIALTCAILLLTNVLNISEVANDIIKDTSGSTLFEMYGNNDERIYNGAEVLAVISEYFSETSNLSEKFDIYIYTNEIAEPITKDFTLDNFNSEYHLIYNGIEENGKMKYAFKKI